MINYATLISNWVKRSASSRS